MESICEKLPLEKIGAFSDFFLDYINKNENLKSFYGEYPEIENFKKIIENKQFDIKKRLNLVTELEKQYAHLDSKPELSLLLEENTFTVTTGHQLNIFTGPLYIPFKIITIINLVKQLKAAYPAYNFVPIYWMATEDHDLEEIQYFNALGQKHVWETEQTGAVGRMKTDGLTSIAKKMGKGAKVFETAYSKSKNLGDAVRDYMHHLFGEHGLITIDADSRVLKSEFSSVIKDDILNNTAFELVNNRTTKIQALGYKTQISPREINFFYLADGLRERIVFENNNYQVLNTDISFTETEILQLIDDEPERFSPNVVLRPLYEEVILPNLAYIGGPSEVPYWLQLKPVFDYYKESFPALIPRNFGMLINAKNKSRISKLGLAPEAVFKPMHALKNDWLAHNSNKELSLKTEREELKKLYKSLLEKAKNIDLTLSRTSAAFETKSNALLDSLEKKFCKAEKRNHTETMVKIEKLKNSLCPGGGLQERKENIILFLEQREDLIKLLIENLEPLDFRFNLIEV